MGTPPTLGSHPQLGLRRFLAPAANVLPSFTAVGVPSVVEPQGPDFLGDGTPNILLLVGADLQEWYTGKGEDITIRTVTVIGSHPYPCHDAHALTVEALPTVKGDFYALGHIPNVIGAIDGTHVALVPPAGVNRCTETGRVTIR
ncbi:hypothetical protein NDU88_001679 [Pleurodeles waltl]|uniref:DDE Tnp4 domain-containing protein n=1 Tax=Pleurodeles waltl TaxID=8319 RepID=A0AAV7MPF4_PLEWA|nr:hypothetical protein NDU88_001679 [Pleurodeles waltl]